MKSWKTTLGGVGAILGGLADICNGLYHNTLPNWSVDFAAITGGIGLLFAKDSNVTGAPPTAVAHDVVPK